MKNLLLLIGLLVFAFNASANTCVLDLKCVPTVNDFSDINTIDSVDLELTSDSLCFEDVKVRDPIEVTVSCSKNVLRSNEGISLNSFYFLKKEREGFVLNTKDAFCKKNIISTLKKELIYRRSRDGLMSVYES